VLARETLGPASARSAAISSAGMMIERTWVRPDAGRSDICGLSSSDGTARD
jgi:hypothetical protein